MSAWTALRSRKTTVIEPEEFMIGPADHGVAFDDEFLETATFATGYKYEVIHGRLFVSPTADSPIPETRNIRRLTNTSPAIAFNFGKTCSVNID